MPSEPAYDVVWPLAPRARRALRPAPRPDGLNGKTIGFLWNGLFKGDRMFELMKEVLAQRAPDARFVDWDAFGNIHGADEREVMARIPDALRDLGVDVVVAAVGS